MESNKDAPIPASNPTQTEPDIEAKAAEKNAAASIFPSRPISKIPALSEKRPARQANNSGVASLIVVSRTDRSNSEKKLIFQSIGFVILALQDR